MKKNNALLCLAVAVLLVSCGPDLFPVETVKGTDFSKYKTYAFLPTDDTSFAKLLNKETLEKTLALLAKSELDKKGFTMDNTNPDCLFKYTLVLKRSYDISQNNELVYQPGVYTPSFDNNARVYYFSSDNKPQLYAGKMDIANMREGTFVIDMIDSKDKKVIWRSSYTGKGNEAKLPPLQTVADIIVPKMFAKLPKK